MNRTAENPISGTDHAFRHDLVFKHTLPLPDAALTAVESVEASITPESRLVMFTEPYSMGADRFRTVQVYLNVLWGAGKLKTLLITSAVPREGKTTAALNVAIALARRGGNKVLLVETDFRHPFLPARLGLESWPGLVRCLQDGCDPLASIRRVDPLGIYVLPAGEIAENPVELLNSEKFSQTISRLRSIADWIILDAPPAMPVPDVLAVRGQVDGCLWVVRAHSTPRETVKEAIQQVGPELVLGMILNEASGLDHSYSQYYGYRAAGMLGTGS